MDALSRDLRFAFRLIRKTPILSIATIVTLAAGIGLNAGVFTVLSGLLLRPRVTVDPGMFVHLQPVYSGTNAPRYESPAFSTRDYLAIRDRTTTLSDVTGWAVRSTNIGVSSPFRELTMLVSCGFFDVYGLDRLERKGLVTSSFSDSTPVRGGKRKRVFAVTRQGLRTAQTVRRIRDAIWKLIEERR